MNSRSLFPAAAVAAVLVLSTPTRAEDGYRTFTNASGKSISAKVLAVEGENVRISLEGTGKEFSVPLSSLSEADREYLADWSPPAPVALDDESGVTVEAINEAFGHELFTDAALWDSEPGEVADRLGWKLESEVEFSESYRSYPGEDYRFLGARPFSAALYGEDDKVTSVSLVFANKGDSFAAAGSGEEHFIEGKPVPGGMEGLRLLMEHDAKTIGEKLAGLLGEAETQKFGEGESRVYVERWDWAGHAFLLSHVEDEYVALAIETTEFADKRGNTKRISDAFIRERIRGYVEKRENGDVVVSNIPMVDQGPKGYCVPATAERLMRFFGVPADMYLLAMAGQTKAGGGTSVERLLDNVGRDIKRKGRSFEIENGELEMRNIQRSIDEGVPLMWALHSTEEFNEISRERTEERSGGDWTDYVEKVKAAAENPSLGPDPDRGHVVIIIGYNEESGEIAFSDSWGEDYRERWITLAEAKQVSQDRFYVIDL